jgi:3-polyprenyl-4-hydroxybenzoate decarboxylase
MERCDIAQSKEKTFCSSEHEDFFTASKYMSNIKKISTTYASHAFQFSDIHILIYSVKTLGHITVTFSVDGDPPAVSIKKQWRLLI